MYVTDIRSWWPIVRGGVEEVFRKDLHEAIPEDVYASLKSGAAQLFVGFSGRKYCGFLVCMRQAETLFVWLAYAVSQKVAGAFYPKLKEIAKAGGMKKLRFESARKGWAKVAATYGFKESATIYEAQV